eukprot:s788_g13.t1
MDSKEYYGEEQRESMLAACSRLTFHLKRQRGEAAGQFMTRWDTAERKVREHDVKLPADFLGFLMVNALQLDSEKTKLLLNYTKGSLKVADVKEWLRVHETDLDLSTLGSDKKKTATYLLDKETTKEIQYVDATEVESETDAEPTELLLATLADLEDSENATENDPVILTESETKEILMTMVKDHRSKGRSYSGAMKAKKNRDLARGFGAGRDGILRPGTYEVSISELKKRTRCNACGLTGHWARECPTKPKRSADSSKTDGFKTKPKEMNFLQEHQPLAESEFFYLESASPSGQEQHVSSFADEGADFCDEPAGSIDRHAATECSTSLQPLEQAPVLSTAMHGGRVKRGRTETDSRPIIQSWLRFILKTIMIMNKAISHKVHMNLKMPGPRGVMTRQIQEMSELLDDKQLEKALIALNEELNNREALRRLSSSRSPTPSGWSRVTEAEQPKTPPRTTRPTTSAYAQIPPTPESRQANMWDIPTELDLNRETPKCSCNLPCLLWVSKTEQNPDRLFWRCSQPRTQQCAFFMWLTNQPLRPPVPDSTEEYIRKRHQDVCPHKNLTRDGTNGFALKETCKDCGKVLRHEKKPLAQYTKKAMNRRSSSPSRSSMTSEPMIPPMPGQSGQSSSSRQNAHQEYQDFLNWRRMKEVTEDSSSSPTYQRQR